MGTYHHNQLTFRKRPVIFDCPPILPFADAAVAVASSIPVKPKKKLNTILGLLVGLMTGVGLALFLEARDQTLKGPDDLGRHLPSVSLLGMIPLLSKAEAGDPQRLLTSQSPGCVQNPVEDD